MYLYYLVAAIYKTRLHDYISANYYERLTDEIRETCEFSGYFDEIFQHDELIIWC